MKAKQTLNETSIREVKEKVDKKLEALIREKLEEKLDQWVTFTFCPEGSLAPGQELQRINRPLTAWEINQAWNSTKGAR